MHYNPDERHDTGPTDEELAGEIEIHEQVVLHEASAYLRAQQERDRLYAAGASYATLKAAGERVTATRLALARKTV